MYAFYKIPTFDLTVDCEGEARRSGLPGAQPHPPDSSWRVAWDTAEPDSVPENHGHLRAYVHLASLAMPMLRESGGSIVVVSSVAGNR